MTRCGLTAIGLLDTLSKALFRLFRSITNTISRGHIMLPDGSNISDCYQLSFVRVAPGLVSPLVNAGAGMPLRQIPLSLLQTDRKFDANGRRLWTSANPGLSYVFFDDAQAEAYLERRWGRRHADAFISLGIGALRADFLRLCYLADKGGFYADTDVCPAEVPLATLRNASIVVVPQLSFAKRACVWNAFIGAAPGHPAMTKLVWKALRRIENRHAQNGGPEGLLEIAGPRLLSPLLFEKGVLWLDSWATFRGMHTKPEKRLFKGSSYPGEVWIDPKNTSSMYNRTAALPGQAGGPVATECPRNWTRRLLQLQLKDESYWMNQALATGTGSSHNMYRLLPKGSKAKLSGQHQVVGRHQRRRSDGSESGQGNKILEGGLPGSVKRF
eukprot:CAMPEP_0183334734 /NCGR_PEP_ID=MMETSP0164_2-20130417/3241_1 /TAXON_ID=221442 /ORGANISM="Coccolithus pelagicus ssp braarudi, Strain PLY182g" /LENGTH=384 /DNA_ID=CAMNT_0025503931 /DNA_START=95 /DNA_END=1249 /DNA_ORIENTATION=-